MGERLYFNLRSIVVMTALQWVLVSYDLLLLYQILRLTSNCNHMRLIITNNLALLNNIWKRKKILFYMLHVEYFHLDQKCRTSLFNQKPVCQYSNRFSWVKTQPNALPIYRLFFRKPSLKTVTLKHLKTHSKFIRSVLRQFE